MSMVMSGAVVAAARAPAKDDMSWTEVGQLGLRYLKIPLVLLLLEMLYWFLTQPSNTLAWIQTVEAFLWHNLSIWIFGSGATELSTHQGWWIRVDMFHQNFPDGRIALYVGDECAGVHEMLFISTLVLLTDGVPQKLKLKSIAVLCSIVFVLNIVRLLLLYPFARSGCDADPGDLWCTSEMYSFHSMMFEWGFLIILVAMWTTWFFWVNGPSRIRKANESEEPSWQFSFRDMWKPMHLVLVMVAMIFFAMAAQSWFGPDTQAAIAEMEDCDSLNEISARCGNAINDYDEAISTAWSLGTIGLLTVFGTVVRIERPKPARFTESE